MNTTVNIWVSSLGTCATHVHSVPASAVAQCRALPSSADRFAFWRKVTGNDAITGHAMAWTVAD